MDGRRQTVGLTRVDPVRLNFYFCCDAKTAATVSRDHASVEFDQVGLNQVRLGVSTVRG